MNAEGLERYLIKRQIPVVGIDVEGNRFHVFVSEDIEKAQTIFAELPDKDTVVFELAELPEEEKVIVSEKLKLWEKVKVWVTGLLRIR